MSISQLQSIFPSLCHISLAGLDTSLHKFYLRLWDPAFCLLRALCLLGQSPFPPLLPRVVPSGDATWWRLQAPLAEQLTPSGLTVNILLDNIQNCSTAHAVHRQRLLPPSRPTLPGLDFFLSAKREFKDSAYLLELKD